MRRFRTALLFISLLSINALLGQTVDTPKDLIEDKFFTTSDGIKLHYFTAGQGPGLVIQPGWMISADIFKPQLENLSDSFQVIVLDPRGQGQSEDTPDNNYIERRARDIQELIAHENLESCILAGWSLGVPEVLYFTDKFGMERMKGLLLIDGPITTAVPQVQSGWKTWLNWLQTDRAGMEKEFMKILFKNEHEDEFVKLIEDRLSKAPSNSSFVSLGSHVMEPKDYSPLLKKVQVPVLITLVSLYSVQAEYFQKANDSAHLELFECGHALFVDEADKFNSLVKDYFIQSDK